MNNFVNTVEELDVFKRAYKISLLIHKAILNFPQIEQYALTDQLWRASKSVCVNLAEGFAKQLVSKAEFRKSSIGSSDQMQVWLRYVKDLGYVDSGLIEKWTV